MATNDYLTTRNQKEQAVKDFLSSQQQTINSNADNTRNSLLKNRDSFLNKLNLDPAATQTHIGSLNMSNEQKLNQQKYDAQKQRIQLILDQTFNMAQQAGLDYQSALAFAREKANQAQQQSYQAQQNQTQMDYQTRINNLKNSYADRGIALQYQYSNQPFDYGSAIARMLAGTAATALTAKYLNSKNQPTMTNSNFAGINDKSVTPYSVSNNLTAGIGGYGGGY